MPSTLVHVALAGLLACALLGDAFGTRSLAVVLGATILIDFDVFVGWFVLGAHRAAFHTLLLPLVVGILLYYDVRLRDRPWLVARWGESAPRIAGVTLVTVLVAGIGPDLVTNGANLLYPVHDQFYAFDGRLRFSTQRGVLQTFVEEESAKGSTRTQQYFTGADPNPEQTGTSNVTETTERVFLLVDSGMQLLLVLAGIVTTGWRLRESRD
ncbi:MAG TPA: metal-dependent hydrolase [Natrialbaceae archaeon]|nr:metal-dependent hydrolase [Natrialbaceae archaeon]